METLTLEPNFLKCFIPILLVQLGFGTLRFHLQGHSVSHNSTGQLLYRVMLVALAACAFYEIASHLYDKLSDHALVFVNQIAMAITVTSCILCHLVNISFFNENDNVMVYLKLKNVDKFLKSGGLLDKIQYYVHSFNSIVIFVVFFISGNLYFYFLFDYVPIAAKCGLFSNGILLMYFEMTLLAGLIYYLTKRLKLFKAMFSIKVSRQTKQNYSYRAEAGNMSLDKQLLPIVDSVSTQELSEYVVCLNNILSTFNTLGKIYNLQIFLHVSTIFVFSFLTIAASIEGTGLKFVSWKALALIYTYMGYYYTLLIVIVIVCNYYYTQVMELRDLCIGVLATSSEPNENAFITATRRMLDLINHGSHVISVYEIFDVDVTLPIKLLMVIAHYTVIIIQLSML